jgi:hypothetical protein
MSDNWEPGYRTWAEGRTEQLLPEALDEFNQENRLKRVERCAHHIRWGADRAMCRCFVYSEEEWRSAVRMAGSEPGDGWLSRPDKRQPPVDIPTERTYTQEDWEF